jgi:hypothetical protein
MRRMQHTLALYDRMSLSVSQSVTHAKRNAHACLLNNPEVSATGRACSAANGEAIVKYLHITNLVNTVSTSNGHVDTEDPMTYISLCGENPTNTLTRLF